MNKRIFKWCGIGLILYLSIAIFSTTTEARVKEKKTQKGTPYFAPKKRVAVLDFEVKVPEAESKIGSGMAEMLITALQDTGKYIVLERQELKNILKEQDLGKEGRIRPETAAKFGEILGAQILIKGVVTEFSQYETIKGMGVFVKGLTLGGGGIITAYVAVDIRMFNASTGEIIESHHTEKKAHTVVVTGGIKAGDVVIGGLNFHKTPLGKATREAIKDIVEFIGENLKPKPWEGRIVKVENDKVIINAGLDVGIRVGDIMEVLEIGEELIDPETGLSLGVQEGQKIGKIEVTDVKQRYSLAKITTGTGFKRNDIVRISPSE